MAQKVDKRLSIVLDELQNAINKHQCRRVKLISYFLDLNWSEVEKAYCIPDIYFLLREHPRLRLKAVAVLQSILQMVGANVDTVAKLGSTKEQLEECKELPGFAFAEIIMTVILGLGEEQFKALRSFFTTEYLSKIHPDNIETPEDLFRRLYQALKVYPGDVELLVQALHTLQLNDAAKMVQKYQDQHRRTHTGVPEEANDAKPLLAHQTNCQAETEQSKERSEAVYPKIERTLSWPCANSSQLQRNSGILEDAYQPANQTLTFSKSVEVEQDGVTEDAAKDTLQPPLTPKDEDEASLSVNGDIIEKDSQPASVTTTTSSILEDDETDQAATEENHTPPPTTEHVQNTTVGSINVDIVEEDPTQQPSTTMAHSNPNRYTDPKQNPSRSKCSTSTFVCCVLVFALLATAIIAGPGGLGVYFENSQELKKQVVLGHDNDTIIVGKVTGLFVGKVNISEHLEENDYSHISRIYVTHSLEHCKRELKSGRALTYQADPTQFTGLLDYIYLLMGSVISYTMCVASVTESSDGLDGNFYIFDDVMDYRDYATNRAVYHHVLQFGTNNKTVCWSLISWVVSKTGYYFIMSETPGNIVYEYHYNIQQVYLDSNDYNEAIKECPEGVYEPYSCVVRVKRGDYVLAHIVLPVAADPMTTHLRLQPMSLSDLKIVMIVAVCVFGVCFLAFFVLLVYTINRWYKRRRYTNDGYMPLS